MFWLLAGALLAAPAAAAVRVVAVGNEGAARVADLRVGDEILAVGGPAGISADVLDLEAFRALEALDSLRTSVELRVRRAGRGRTVRMPQGPWNLLIQPLDAATPAPLAQAQRIAWELAAQEKWRELAEHCRQAASLPLSDGQLRILRRGCADQLERGGESGASIVHRAAAVDLGRRAGADGALAHDLLASGTALGKMQRFADAATQIAEARALWQQLSPGALGEAMATSNLGILASMQGRSADAEEMWNTVLARYRAMRAIPALEAGVLNNLFIVVRRRGDLVGAQALLERAIMLNETMDAGSQSLARNYNNLALLARQRGDFGAAEQSLSAALAIRKRLDPASLDTQRTLGNLANLALDRGDIDTAADLHASTLANFRATIPGSPTLAANLRNLAAARIAQSRLQEARALLDEALVIESSSATATLTLADTRLAFGQLAERSGDLSAAAESYDRALEIQQGLAADGLGVAECLQRRGLLRLRLDAADAAAADFERAVRIRARLSPGSLLEAESRLGLARTLIRRGRPDDALAQLRLAVDAVEEQFEHAGASIEGQLGLGPRAAPVYRTLIATLADQQRDAEAFAASERYRAQLLRRMLEERDLDLPQRWPAEQRQRRSRLNAQYEQLQSQIVKLTPQDAALPERLGQLAKLRTERMALAVQMRAALPASIATAPTVIDIAQAAARLRPNEAMLSYVAGDDATYLFLLKTTPAGGRLITHRIAISRDALAAQVGQWRSLMRAPPGTAGERSLAALSASLYGALLGPVANELTGVERLAILPDGALWQLPFSALVAGGGDAAPRYLIENFALSVELAWSLRDPAVRSPQRAFSLAAFGDPVLAPELATRFPRLPATRDELQALRGLFGSAATIRSGALATEPELMRLAPSVRYVHIASHAIARPALPLDSSILLSADARTVGRADNSLRASEIIERLRLDAELVTLSACDSGAGAELGGEGLVGLTWAFRFAGARAVLASLWPVGDRSTASLMADFYSRLAQGVPKDEALRGAQLAALQLGRRSAASRTRGPAAPAALAAQPVRWAAFELFGQP